MSPRLGRERGRVRWTGAIERDEQATGRRRLRLGGQREQPKCEQDQ
ncbi:MAG TPA: hypothetical protein VFB41_05160 [Solirubrobacteraceae bacterium]|nr:hypothetical protein [Solirubrobacteraceae bacterium]